MWGADVGVKGYLEYLKDPYTKALTRELFTDLGHGVYWCLAEHGRAVQRPEAEGQARACESGSHMYDLREGLS